MNESGDNPRGATVVLVHGAFHGAWCWESMLPILRRDGLRVEAVTLPFTGFDDDVEEVRRVLDASPGDLVVCGHSYGGRVMSAATLGHARVKHLVYLAAFMLTPEQLRKFEQDWQTSWSASRIVSDTFDLAVVREKFYGDCSDAVAHAAFDRLRPMVEFGPTVGLEVRPWQRTPSTYVVCKRDRSLNPEWQHQMASNATSAIEIETGHSPFLSSPKIMAAVLASVARTGSPVADPDVAFTRSSG